MSRSNRACFPGRCREFGAPCCAASQDAAGGVLSSDGRLALVANDLSGALPPWVLPSGSVRATETYREAAVRVLRDAVGAMPARGGTVEGCRWAQVPVPVGRSRREAHVFIFRLAAVGDPPDRLSWRGATRWAGPEQWQELCTRCDLPDVDVLLTGYLEGSIPDGRITLGP
ncbi:NUDIX domain-containing protein [Streptomyces lydicus]|uniref:NUDIX domain-containing protein n=1 Tax=Streptomyces lydicus TaxID=47763 RepID=UPI0036F5801E